MDNSNCTEYQGSAICPVCGCADSQTLFCATSWEAFARDRVYEIRCCDNCHVAFTSPAACPEVLNVFYAHGLYRVVRNRLHPVIEVLSRVFQWSRLRKITRVHQRGRLLDMGCGKGRFLAYAVSRGWDVYGVEPSENNFRVACSKLGDRVVHNLDELDSIEKFDVVTLWHVLEHGPTPVQVLRQILPYLKATGFIYVAVPNFASLQAWLGRGHWSHLDIPRHCVHYTPSTLKYTLALAGYKLLWVDYFSIEFNPIGVLQTALNLLGCEPGLIYSLVKRNISCDIVSGKLRFFYNVAMAVVGVPILILPAILFACLESLIGRGGTFLICATPFTAGK